MLIISDYGAHVAEDIGMPSIFGGFEAEVRQLAGQKIILRSAEHMHNWGRVIPQGIESGELPSFQSPTDKVQPTIYAGDLGLISAELLMQMDGTAGDTLVHAEGPSRYSADDVAAAISELSGKNVSARAIPRSDWDSLRSKMPPALASLLSKTDDAKNKWGLVDVGPGESRVLRGSTSLIEGLRPLVTRN